MKQDDNVKVKGKVVELLPNALFRIKLENDMTILGHISGKIRKNGINILCGDTVDVEMSVYDLTKGRIVFRYKV